MHRCRLIFVLIFFVSSYTVQAEYKINLTFESGFKLKSQEQLLPKLINAGSKKSIEKIISNQDWIKSYSIAYKPFKKNISINIVNREPLFALNEDFFYDSSLIKFKYDQSSKNFIMVSGPIRDVENILIIINYFDLIVGSKLEINYIKYNHATGWDLYYKNILIRLGKEFSKEKFINLKDTLNYLLANSKIPSIIDMRYKDGVALKYGE